MNLAEFIVIGPLSRDSVFNVIIEGVRKGSHSRLVGWLKHE